MERISTGVTGLDKIMGGYYGGKSFLITGTAGTGKTVMALQLIQKSCSEGKKCDYVAIEETREDLLLQAKAFGWDFSRYEKEGLLNIAQLLEERMVEAKYEFNYYGHEAGFGGLLDLIDEDTEVSVIDNLGVLALDMTLSQFRQQMDYLAHSLSKRKCTSLLISDDTLMNDKKEVALYSVYGAIRLMKRDNPYTDSRERVMEIVKMRSTAVPIEYIVYQIGKNGIWIMS